MSMPSFAVQRTSRQSTPYDSKVRENGGAREGAAGAEKISGSCGAQCPLATGAMAPIGTAEKLRPAHRRRDHAFHRQHAFRLHPCTGLWHMDHHQSSSHTHAEI